MTGYFPASGIEGAGFMARWCDHCEADAAFQRAGDMSEAPGCSILADSMAGTHPAEWVEGENGPVCTAFVEEATPDE